MEKYQIISCIAVIIFIIEIRFSPRIQISRNRDILIFYNVYILGTRRNYINTHIKW